MLLLVNPFCKWDRWKYSFQRKGFLWRPTLHFWIFHLSVACSQLGFIWRNKELKNQQNHFSTPKFSLSAVTSWQFPFGFISTYFHPGAEIMAKYFFISFYTAEKSYFLAKSDTHLWQKQSHLPSLSNFQSIMWAIASNLHRANTSFVLSNFIYQSLQLESLNLTLWDTIWNTNFPWIST